LNPAPGLGVVFDARAAVADPALPRFSPSQRKVFLRAPIDWTSCFDSLRDSSK